MLVACDAAGIIYDITKIFLEIYQGIGVPGKPLGKRFELDLLQIPFLGCKDQREEWGVGSDLIRGFGRKWGSSHLMASVLCKGLGQGIC